MMKKLLSLAALCLLGCLHDPYAPQPGYGRDGLYCWHVRGDGSWYVVGLSDTCPLNTPAVNVGLPTYPDR